MTGKIKKGAKNKTQKDPRSSHSYFMVTKQQITDDLVTDGVIFLQVKKEETQVTASY